MANCQYLIILSWWQDSCFGRAASWDGSQGWWASGRWTKEKSWSDSQNGTWKATRNWKLLHQVIFNLFQFTLYIFTLLGWESFIIFGKKPRVKGCLEVLNPWPPDSQPDAISLFFSTKLLSINAIVLMTSGSKLLNVITTPQCQKFRT